MTEVVGNIEAKNEFTVTKDIEKSKRFYHDVFGIQKRDNGIEEVKEVNDIWR